MKNSLQIRNGRIVTPFRILEGTCIRVENGKIAALFPESEPDPALETLDARGNYISPGFIDLHLHGGGGFDFMDGSEEAIIGPAVAHARFGTTSMTPTTVACDFEKTRRFLGNYDRVKAGRAYKGANLAGIHLEGPYLSEEQRGAQDIRFIKNPDKNEYEAIAGMTKHLVRWDAAPELPGSLEFGDFLRKEGIIASIAHSNATYEEALASSEHGFTHVTHFNSGTSTVSRKGAFRTAGINEFAYLHDDVTVEVIADGCHLPASLLKLIYKIKGASKMMLVTDAIRAACTDMTTCRLGDGESGIEVIIEDGVAKMPDRTCFAGSVATMNRLVRTMIHLANVPLHEAVGMATISPARFLGIENRKGILAPGMDADLVIFDENIDIMTTMVNGEIVYTRT